MVSSDLDRTPIGQTMVGSPEVQKAMGMTNCGLRADVNGDCAVNIHDLQSVIGSSKDIDCATMDTSSLGASGGPSAGGPADCVCGSSISACLLSVVMFAPPLS